MRKKSRLESLSLEAEAIVKEELNKAEIPYQSIVCNVYPQKTVGVQGDERTYGHPVDIHIISPRNKEIYENHIEKISSRITNEIKGINHVIYTLKVKQQP